MLTIKIKDLEMHLSNLNLLPGKKVICFELLAPKKKTGKQTTSALHDKF